MKKQNLKRIGFWQSESEPNLPLVSKFIDSTWNHSEKLMILDYLQKGKVITTYRGWSTCRVCEKKNGSSDLSDGVYVWPEGYYHYIAHHNVKPTEEFLNYIKLMMTLEKFKDL